MKRAIRIAILMVGLVGTFIAAAVQQVPALTVAHYFCAHPDNQTAQQPCHRSRNGCRLEPQGHQITSGN